MKRLKLIPGFILLGCAFYLFAIRGLQFIYTDSESMMPTIIPNDRMVVVRVRGKLPGRGIMVNFRFVRSGIEYHIKRVIGLPGDMVEIKNKRLYLNGEPRDEPYLYEESTVYSFGPAVVPAGHIFVLGDNRNNSLDSSDWGFLPVENVIGKVVMVYWPYIRLLD